MVRWFFKSHHIAEIDRSATQNNNKKTLFDYRFFFHCLPKFPINMIYKFPTIYYTNKILIFKKKTKTYNIIVLSAEEPSAFE